MSIQLSEESVAALVAEIKKLFGPPPVLSSENAEAYDETMAQYVRAVKPTDINEEMLVRDLTDSNWEKIRYGRHMTIAVERMHSKRLELEAERARKSAQGKLEVGRETAKIFGQSADKPKTELEKLYAHEETVSGLEEQISDINCSASEIDHARALQEGIEYFQQLDNLQNRHRAWSYGALDQLQRYREGLGRRQRPASDEVVDADFTVTEMRPKQVEATPVQPAE